jgi:hypothetical protein
MTRVKWPLFAVVFLAAAVAATPAAAQVPGLQPARPGSGITGWPGAISGGRPLGQRPKFGQPFPNIGNIPGDPLQPWQPGIPGLPGDRRPDSRQVPGLGSNPWSPDPRFGGQGILGNPLRPSSQPGIPGLPGDRRLDSRQVPGLGSNPWSPDPRFDGPGVPGSPRQPDIDEILKNQPRLPNPQPDLSKYFYQPKLPSTIPASSTPRKPAELPSWARWEYAVGLFVACLVGGLIYGRFGRTS